MPNLAFVYVRFNIWNCGLFVSFRVYQKLIWFHGSNEVLNKFIRNSHSNFTLFIYLYVICLWGSHTDKCIALNILVFVLVSLILFHFYANPMLMLEVESNLCIATIRICNVYIFRETGRFCSVWRSLCHRPADTEIGALTWNYGTYQTMTTFCCVLKIYSE